MNRNLKNLGKRPKCPECGAKNPASRGRLYWQCCECGRSFSKLKSRRIKPKNIPDCPKCGAEGDKWVTSSGDRWQCHRCKRRTSKSFHSKRIDLGERPKCPVCGADEPHSIGPCWRCRKCYKAWVKESKREFKLNELDLVMAPVHKI